MGDLIEFIVSVLLWPYFWWHGHNQNSNLGVSPDEDEAERFWLNCGMYGIVIVGVVFVLYYFLHSGAAHPST